MDLKGFWLGLKAAIIASSCCSLPLALVIVFSTLGAGSVTAALKIPGYKLFFEAAGAFFILVSLYISIRKRSGGTCGIIDARREWQLIVVSLVSYVALTFILVYLVIPIISEAIFG